MKRGQFWCERIEELIKQNTVEVDGQRQTYLKWIDELIRELILGCPKGNDGNMYLAEMMGFVMAVWFARICHAKSLDKRRPLSQRKTIAETRSIYIKMIIQAMKTRKPVLNLNFPPNGGA